MNSSNKQNSSVLRIFLALLLIVIGFSGVILPILPGWPLIFWGLFIIGGSALIDRTFLKYFPEKTKRRILKWLETKEKKK